MFNSCLLSWVTIVTRMLHQHPIHIPKNGLVCCCLVTHTLTHAETIPDKYQVDSQVSRSRDILAFG